MSQHSQRTQFGPSRASVATTGVLVGLSALATGYVTAGPWSVRQVVATGLGVGLTTLLLTRVVGLMAERAVVADRAEREAERAERAARDERESGRARELEEWQSATSALLDAYLTGRAVNFHGEVVPDYVRTRLADLAPPVSQPEPPPVDEGPVVYPEPTVDETRAWLRDPVGREVDRAVTDYLDEELDPHGYQADPARPWVPAAEPPPFRAFEPVRPELAQVPVPLPPRDGYVDPGPYESFVPVSPGRVDPDATAVMTWPDPDATEVIQRIRS